MIFVRTGPRFLFLHTADTVGLKNLLLTELAGRPVDFNQAMEIASEDNTIIMVVPHAVTKAWVNDADYIVVVPFGSSVVLAKLINLQVAHLLKQAELGAGLLIQRLPFRSNNVIEMIKKDYHAHPLGLIEAINTGQSNDTIVVFTDAPLQKNVQLDKVIEPCLLIHQPIPQMYKELRREAVRYFTQGLDKSEWYEVRINIYDAADRYDIHARRVELVLEDLEAGLILGETWTKDHALALFSVVAYQIRLFTMIDPLELKTLLIGLEYDENGSRFVDIDVYYRSSKIEWATIAKRLPFGRRKTGSHYRRELYSCLSPKTKEKILALEKSL